MTQALPQHKVTNPSEGLISKIPQNRHSSEQEALRRERPASHFQPGQLDPDISWTAGPSGAAHAQGQRQSLRCHQAGLLAALCHLPQLQAEPHTQHRIGCGVAWASVLIS